MRRCGPSIQQVTKKNEPGFALQALLPANPQDGGSAIAYASLTKHVLPPVGATRFTVSLRAATLQYDAPDHQSPILGMRPMTNTFVTIGPSSKTELRVAVTLPGQAPTEPVIVPWSVGDFRSISLQYDGGDAGGTTLRVVTAGIERGTVALPPLDTSPKVIQLGVISYSVPGVFGSGARTAQVDDVLVRFE